MIGLISKYKNKRVLVTGHTGFKGSWLVLWLNSLGADVVGYSLGPPTQPNLFDSIGLQNHLTHIRGDINDYEAMHAVFKKHRPQIVFHLAAQPLVRLSYKTPLETYNVNVMGTANVLEAVRSTDSVHSCVVVTSDKCYENKEWIYGYRENDSVGGYDPYSSSKGCAELVVGAYQQSFFNPKDYGKTHEVSLSSVRAGNIIGGGDWGEDRLVPDCVCALSKGKTITIRNPHAVRPWQYVLEPLAGYLLLGMLMFKNGKKYSGPWNFGPNSDGIVSVKDMVAFVLNAWGKGKFQIIKDSVLHEASLLKLDVSKACRFLGWRIFYDVEQGVKRTIDWYKRFYAKIGRNALYAYTLKEIKKYEENMQYNI